MSIDLSQFHQVFFEESLEGLDIMEAALMELDPDAVDSEVINTVFRAAHSIKGGGATFGFQSISEFTHELETILDQVRDGRRGTSKSEIDLFLQSVDCMREMIEFLRQDEDRLTEESKALMQEFSTMLSAGRESRADTELPSQEPEKEGKRRVKIHFHPGRDVLQTGNDTVRMFRELAELATIQEVKCSSNLPPFSDLHPEECFLSWSLTLESEKSREDLLSVFEWVEDESTIEYTELKDPADSERTSDSAEEKIQPDLEEVSSPAESSKQVVEKETSKSSGPGDSGSIRVGIEKVDNLINMVGELVITQSMLGQLGTDFHVEHLPKLMEGLGQLEQNTRELQESVMRIRMLPISFAFSRFPRLVRDLGNKLNKSINLIMLGEQTELDKTVMEKIGDPLVHLVRNAIDHGIETPQERLEKGKAETGTITLNAYHQSGNVVIEITDDGKGLNRDVIVEKATEKGIISVSEKDSLSDDQVYDLIFHPGFSTAKEVSDVSGRGVGMDVVKKNIQSLNGAVELKSTMGEGSKITIRLPLTLAILDGQLVRIGKSIYIFPLVSIVESMQYCEENISEIAGGCSVFRLRDDYVPAVALHNVFSIEADANDLASALMVVVESEGEKVGLVVDELLAQQQVVIKSLENNYQRVEGVSGATILGDGTVALILDIPGIVKLAGESYKEAQAFIASRQTSELVSQRVAS